MSIARMADDLDQILDGWTRARPPSWATRWAPGSRCGSRSPTPTRSRGWCSRARPRAFPDRRRRAARRTADAALADALEHDGIAAFVDRWERQPCSPATPACIRATRRASDAIRLANDPQALAASLRGAGQGVDGAAARPAARVRGPDADRRRCARRGRLATAHARIADGIPDARLELDRRRRPHPAPRAPRHVPKHRARLPAGGSRRMTDPPRRPATSAGPGTRLLRHPVRAFRHRHRQGHHQPARGSQRLPAPDRRPADRRVRADPGRRRRSVACCSPARATRRSARAATSATRATPAATSATTASPASTCSTSSARSARCRSRSSRSSTATRSVAGTCSTWCATCRSPRTTRSSARSGHASGASTRGSGSACWRGWWATRRPRRSGSCAASTRRRRRSRCTWSTRSSRWPSSRPRA